MPETSSQTFPTRAFRTSFPVPGGRALRFVVLVLIVLPLAACATKRDIRDLRDEIVELNSQNRALLLELERAAEAQQDSIRMVANSLQQGRAETTRRLASIEDQLITVQEVAGLSQQQVASLRDAVDRNRAQAAAGGFDDFGAGGADAGVGGAEELYDAALQQYDRGSYAAARAGFQQIVSQYGGHDLAPQARYFVADILYQEGDLEGALDAFLEIGQFHPEAERVPDAIYRAGRLHLELGNPEEAADAFQRVVNTWPDADVTPLAEDELRRLQ